MERPISNLSSRRFQCGFSLDEKITKILFHCYRCVSLASRGNNDWAIKDFSQRVRGFVLLGLRSITFLISLNDGKEKKETHEKNSSPTPATSWATMNRLPFWPTANTNGRNRCEQQKKTKQRNTTTTHQNSAWPGQNFEFCGLPAGRPSDTRHHVGRMTFSLPSGARDRGRDVGTISDTLRRLLPRRRKRTRRCKSRQKIVSTTIPDQATRAPVGRNTATQRKIKKGCKNRCGFIEMKITRRRAWSFSCMFCDRKKNQHPKLYEV